MSINPPDLLLASASPRRHELLQQLGLSFAVCSPDIDELHCADEAIADYACRMAREKAQAAWQQIQPATPTVLIAADTCGELDGELLGKPRDFANAQVMLRQLSGRVHHIHSAFALFDGQMLQVRNVISAVTFRNLSDDEIQRYWATGEPQDKAGAYAIQGIGAQFVAHLDGSYSAVMGLPLFELSQALNDYHIRTL